MSNLNPFGAGGFLGGVVGGATAGGPTSDGGGGGLHKSKNAGGSSSNVLENSTNDPHSRLVALTNASRRERGLIQVEEGLQQQVDDDFFLDPKSFNSLRRVTDVLGSQLMDHNGGGGGSDYGNRVSGSGKLHSNPAYLALKRQQDIVEDAIEYISVKHCSELHQSVSAMGKVARELDESMDRVQRLRRQVHGIKENLGATQRQAAIEAHKQQQQQQQQRRTDANTEGNHRGVTFADGEGGAQGTTSTTEGGGRGTMSILKQQGTDATAANNNTSSVSLRELWLKKLECEAVLVLLGKLEIIREAPGAFDSCIHPLTKGGKLLHPIRVGAATCILKGAIDTMFSEDVAQIQALTKVNEQLMTRKQRLEEMIWDALYDVLYLRTGNTSNDYIGGLTRILMMAPGSAGGAGRTTTTSSSSSGGGGGGIVRRRHKAFLQEESFYTFTNITMEELYHQSDDESSVEGDDEIGGGNGVGIFNSNNPTTFTALNYNPNYPYRMIPLSLLKDTDFDLKEAELRCVEDIGAGGNGSNAQGRFGGSAFDPTSAAAAANNRLLPRYTDATLATRVLVESLGLLNRLDEVERYLQESVQQEIRRVVEQQQGRTYVRMEKRRLQRMRLGKRHGGMGGDGLGGGSSSSIGAGKDQPFKHHWKNLLRSFEHVMLRLCHLAQILRYRISSDPLLSNYQSSTSPFAPVIEAAFQAMNRELVTYLKSCMKSVDVSKRSTQDGISNVSGSGVKGGGGRRGGVGGANNPNLSGIGGSNVSSRGGGTSMTRGGGGTGGGGDDSTLLGAAERGVFSLGIITEHPGSLQQSKKMDGPTTSLLNDTSYAKLLSTKATVSEMSTEQFVMDVLFPRMDTVPQVRYALTFRRSLAKWTSDVSDMKRELATISGEKIVPTYNTTSMNHNANAAVNADGTSQDPLEHPPEEALQFLDAVIQKKLLPVLQEDAVHSTTSALEREDAFMPVYKNHLYSSSSSSRGMSSELVEQQPLCLACQVLLDATSPLFSALHRLPKGGELYMPLVAVLEHAVLAFVSRAKQRVRNICGGKKADDLLGEYGNVKNKSGLSVAMEQRRAFALLMSEYNNYPDGSGTGAGAGASSSSPDDLSNVVAAAGGGKNAKGDNTAKTPSLSMLSQFNPHNEENALQQELTHLQLLFRFQSHKYGEELIKCSDDELTFAACLAHSLLKLSNSLERRLKSSQDGGSIGSGSGGGMAGSQGAHGPTRQLRDAINAIKAHGIRVAKFVRMDVLVNTVRHMSKICRTYSLLTADAIRLPPCVNELGEYLTNISDLLRETGGNSVTAYALSSLEQYIPLLLMESVRYIGKNDGRMRKCVITLKGIESLDRSGAVLYRDLKNATSFDGSYWDDAAAGDSFERSASFVSLLELDMNELESYCRKNRNEFSDADFSLMFSMNCPRRQGDVRKYYDLKEKGGSSKK